MFPSFPAPFGDEDLLRLKKQARLAERTVQADQSVIRGVKFEVPLDLTIDESNVSVTKFDETLHRLIRALNIIDHQRGKQGAIGVDQHNRRS